MDPRANVPASDPFRYRVSELSPHHFGSWSDDAIGSMASRAALSEVPWKPDVAPAVTDRLARDKVAYPGFFDAASRTLSGRDMATGRAGHAAQGAGGARRPDRGIALGVTALALVVAAAGLSLSAWGSDVITSIPPPAGGAPDMAAAPLPAAAAAAIPAARPATEPDVGEVDDRVEAGQPVLTILGAHPVRDGEVGARVQLDWAPGGIVPDSAGRTQFHRKVRGGNWTPLAASPDDGSVEMTLKPGKEYVLRVRSIDDEGNPVAARRLRVVLAVREWDSERIERTSGASAGLSTDFNGASVALVAPTGPSLGAMRVRVDEGEWMTGDLRGPEPVERVVVFSQGLENGRHSLDIGVEESPIALESVMFVRTPDTWASRS